MKPTILFTFLILLLPRETFAQINAIDVVENTVKIAAFKEEVFYLGFAEGDQVVFSFLEEKGKELKEVEITEMPSVIRFKEHKIASIDRKVLNVQKTTIFKFRFSNNALGGRVCKFKIQRIPSSDSTLKFNSAISWRTVFDSTEVIRQESYLIRKEVKPVTIITPEKYFINSGRNALFQGGSSRVTIPVQLPKGTIEWYYSFSAYRNEAEVKETMNQFSLFGQISRLIDKTGVTKILLEQLTAPPGGNICDIYLLDPANRAPFESKTEFRQYPEGSRENLNSGTIAIKSTISPMNYIGIKNPDSGYGIHVSLEVVAIVLDEEWGMRSVRSYAVISKEEPYIMP